MQVLKYFNTLSVFLMILFTTHRAIALEVINEKTIKNFTYYLEFSERRVTLKNGKYVSPLRPGKTEDIIKYVFAKIEKYIIVQSSISKKPIAIVILSENALGSGFFYQITGLVSEKNKIIQTNSIMLGDRIVIKRVRFQKGKTNSKRDSIFLKILTHKATDPLCCPSQIENICFNLVYDENQNKIKIVPCEEEKEANLLPIVLDKPYASEFYEERNRT